MNCRQGYRGELRARFRCTWVSCGQGTGVKCGLGTEVSFVQGYRGELDTEVSCGQEHSSEL